MTGITAALLLLSGGFLLWLGGEGVVRGAASLALRRGISPLVIGLTVIGFGTSAPELFVSLFASLQGNPGIALGNVIGSNIANIGLVLGLSALFIPLAVSASTIRFEIPLIGLTAGLAWIFASNGRLSPWEGWFCLLGLALILTLTVRREKKKPANSNETTPPDANSLLPSVWHDLVYSILGLIALSIGSHFFVKGASAIARLFAVSEFFIGLSIVAVGTSLPEMVASLVAILRKQSDLAVGNIVGSNLFNILLILGLVAGLTGVPIPADALRFDFPVLFAFSVLILPIAFTQQRISRWEGLLLLSGYVGYIIFIIQRG